MQPLRLDRVVVQRLVLLGGLLLGAHVAFLDIGHDRPHVGQHEELFFVDVFGKHFLPLVLQFDRVQLLVDDEVEIVDDFGHSPVVVLHVDVLGLLHLRLDALLREELDERLVLGQTFVGAVQLDAALFRLAVGHQLLGLGHESRHQILLEIVEILDGGAVLLVELVVALGDGTGDDQRRAGVVDEHRVDLVDDGEVVLARGLWATRPCCRAVSRSRIRCSCRR